MGNAANGIKSLFYKTTKIRIQDKKDCLAWEIDLTGLKRISIEKVDDDIEMYLYNGETNRFDPISFGSVAIEKQHRLFAVRCSCRGLLECDSFSKRLSAIYQKSIKMEDGSMKRESVQYLISGTFSYGTVINPFNFIRNYKDQIKVGEPFYGDLIEGKDVLNLRQEFFNTVLCEMEKFLEERLGKTKELLISSGFDELIKEANTYIANRVEQQFNTNPLKGWNENIECKLEEIKKTRVMDTRNGGRAR